MITMVQPLHVGNALRLFIEPPADAVRWRVLRKGSDTFSGDPEDPSALVAYEGDERVVVDAAHLQNEVMAFYRPFYLSFAGIWTPGPTAYGTPASIYEEHTTDVMSLVRERLEAGLKVEVERGSLVHELGYVQVYTAPPSQEQNLLFPLVTITLSSESSDVRAVGETHQREALERHPLDRLLLAPHRARAEQRRREARAHPGVPPDHHVLEKRQLAEDLQVLEGPRHAERRARVVRSRTADLGQAQPHEHRAII